MAKRLTVGRSERRTPAKHALMNSMYGIEVGAANNIAAISRLRWTDLTAGDGTVPDGLTWRSNCSPGINAYHATHSKKPVDVTLFEIKPAVYGRLLASLTENLPEMGYQQTASAEWSFGDHVTLRAVHDSGAHAPVGNLRTTDSVLVSNDPNAITEWAMRPTFSAEIAARTSWSRCISTMGCNTAGLKRLDTSIRTGWFERLNEQVRALPSYRDLLLVAIEGDRAQWAYLLCEPVKWRHGKIEPVVKTAFGRYGYQTEMVWFRQNAVGFGDLARRLFLTRQERGEAS